MSFDVRLVTIFLIICDHILTIIRKNKWFTQSKSISFFGSDVDSYLAIVQQKFFILTLIDLIASKYVEIYQNAVSIELRCNIC